MGEMGKINPEASKIERQNGIFQHLLMSPLRSARGYHTSHITEGFDDLKSSFIHRSNSKAKPELFTEERGIRKSIVKFVTEASQGNWEDEDTVLQLNETGQIITDFFQNFIFDLKK